MTESSVTYTVQTFTTVATNCTWTIPAGVTAIDVVLVGGGGGAGFGACGGGGGGGRVAISNSSFSVSAGNVVTLTVGAGGNGGYNDNQSLWSKGSAGGSSSISIASTTYTAVGGGAGGGSGQANGDSGGSGGGGTACGSTGSGGAAVNTSISNFSAFGSSGAGGSGGGGGGGGAGSAASGINGGDGRLIWGVTLAGGGGGWSNGAGGTGGGGSAGAGFTSAVSAGTSGTNGLGGGGGGGQAGGSGRIMIRYVADSTPPTVTNVTSNATGTLGLDGSPNILVDFSETVTVNTSGGTPSILLETGATDRSASYVSGSGTRQLTFTYLVQEGDSSNKLDYASTTALGLNGGTIKDAAGNNATLTLPAPGAAGSLGANRSIVIDAIRPTFSSASVVSSGREVRVVFSETLSVNFPSASAFSLSDSGTTRIPTSVTFIDSRTAALAIADTITVGRNVTLSYTDPTTNNDLNAIQDVAGNDALSFSNSVVANGSSVLNRLSTPVTITISSIETSAAVITYAAITNASSHNLLLYSLFPTNSFIGTYTSFASGSSITGLNPATRYQVKIQAVGDGITYESSTASSGTNFDTLIRPAIISIQPSDTSTTDTRNALFSVTATARDGGALTYQWQRSVDSGASFSAISGATSATLSLTSLTTLSNDYRYRVVITNSRYSVSATETSTAATLTVNPAISLSGGSNLSSPFGVSASSSAITISGGTGNITFSLSGSTTGLSINSANGIVTTDGTTPRGTVNLTITATDESGATATKSIIVTITTGSSTITLAFSTSPKKGTPLTITATVSVAGTVRFFENGRVISACKSRSTSGTNPITAICNWRPRTHGSLPVKATLTPTSADYTGSTSTESVIVTKRTAQRS